MSCGPLAAPKVFLSHAGEDKPRFVNKFAESLRARGIDVWLDKWEILPGDSLVDKIFEEGLKDADAVIIVVSSNSVNKPWVREELNASVVQRLKKRTKIIPVVIDNCEVPEALKSTVWERISDLSSYDKDLDRIVAAVYEHREKPALGSPPAYVGREIADLPGLTRADTIVLNTVCLLAIRNNNWLVHPEAVYLETDPLNINREQVLDSFEVLDTQAYLQIGRVLGGVPRGISHVRPTASGFETFAKANIPEYDRWTRQVGLEIVNASAGDNQAIAHSTGIPQYVVDHILDVFSGRGWLRVSKTIGGCSHIFSVSPLLKRALS